MMGRVAQDILKAIADERFGITSHAAERLRKRLVPAWQAVDATASAQCLRERPNDHPFPVAEFEIVLPDGTKAKCVRSWRITTRSAMLVTLHFYDQ